MRTFLLAALVSVFAMQEARADRVVLVAGGGEKGEGALATESKLNSPFGVDFDAAGNLYFVEIDGHRVCRIDPKGILTRIAGTGVKGLTGDGGPPLAAEFNALHNLTIAPNGDIYLADTLNSRVRKIDAKSGLITTVAGSEKGFGGDGGPATKAKFSGIYCATLHPGGDRLYLADLDNRRIRMVELETGIVSTVAGNGERGVPNDGVPARTSPLVDPRAVTVDRQGNVYILERSGNALRVVIRGGPIQTLVGTGEKGASGDGGSARQATMNGPKHLCVDRDGGILIADTENHVVRKYMPADGKIVRIAGSGQRGAGGKADLGGSPLEVHLNQPHGVYVHADGDLYISDSTGKRILKVERDK